ncbi:MAG: RDD family protein [Bacteroidetes bacterium]|nr:RDD family protein [Bacteroidota bacterium]MBU1485169.1 RDD family protein [Bacteroidota bacterium]MBU2045527.1 RDD family protein [Bacteroidota bacterium]MBU2266588.1 RDD family protein [Bacteroidota bacterium]MBU2376609.1 RDD family protein [Bacteroidota bacterium]
MENAIYTLVIKGKPAGPFTLADLKEQKIQPDSFLRKPGMDDYKEAHEFAEIRELLHFNQQFTEPQYFAGFDLRMLADAIDWFVIFGMMAIVELLIVMFLNNQTKTLITIGSGLLLMPFFKFFYHLYMEYHRQATIGKGLMNIKVTNMQGLKPSLQEVFLRNLGKVLSTLTLFFGYFYLFLNKKQQTLHDKMANTLVIKERLM